MTTLADLFRYQECGFVKGFDSKSLKSANEMIAESRNATPQGLRQYFKSAIRKDGVGYTWEWVMK